MLELLINFWLLLPYYYHIFQNQLIFIEKKHIEFITNGIFAKPIDIISEEFCNNYLDIVLFYSYSNYAKVDKIDYSLTPPANYFDFS